MTSDDLIERAMMKVANLRAHEVGGCFCPADIEDPGECADFTCYCYQQVRREVESVLSALKPADRFNGMVLVPEERTEAMVAAMDTVVSGEGLSAAELMEALYRAMIAAAKEEE